MIRTERFLGPRALAIVLAGLLGAACAGPGGRTPRIPEAERQAYALARAPQPEDMAASVLALEAFLVEYPNSQLADDAMEELARIEFLQGGREAAVDRLRETVARFPDGDRADSIRLRLALWDSEAGELPAAREWLEAVRPEGLNPTERRFFFRLGARLALTDGDRLVYLARFRADVASELEKETEQDPLSPEIPALRQNVSGLDAQIDTLVLGMPGEDLLRVIPELGSEVPAGRLRLVLCWRALVGGDPELARFWLEEARGYPMTPTDAARMESLAARLGAADGDDALAALPTFREAAAAAWPALEGLELRVGVVLPLSGRYAPFGQEALRGLLLAAEVFETEPPPPYVPPPPPDPLEEFLAQRLPPEAAAPAAPAQEPEPAQPAEADRSNRIQLVVRDSAGNPERAAAAVRELAADEAIVAVIGPIFSAESEAAAREAERFGVPLLTLSNRPEIVAERDFVFRLRMTADDEINRLVEYAVEEAGASTFAILYPMNRYGRGMRARYWEAVVARGGTIVAAAGYEPEATDFKAPIRSMVGFDLITPDERTALQERSRALRRGRRLEPEVAAQLKEILYTQLGPEAEPLPPIVDFDALFIPDGAEKIQLIAPQLAFHEVEGVQLLGSSDWNDQELIEIGRDHVAGALVSTPFYAGSDFEIVGSFVDRYAQSFESPPDEFSASAFDALNLVLTQAALENTSRLTLREGIRRIHGFPGVSGVTSIQPDGNARKRPFLLQVKRRRFVGID